MPITKEKHQHAWTIHTADNCPIKTMELPKGRYRTCEECGRIEVYSRRKQRRGWELYSAPLKHPIRARFTITIEADIGCRDYGYGFDAEMVAHALAEAATKGPNQRRNPKWLTTKAEYERCRTYRNKDL